MKVEKIVNRMWVTSRATHLSEWQSVDYQAVAKPEQEMTMT